MRLKSLALGTLLGIGLAAGGYGVYWQTRSAVETRKEEPIPAINVSKYSLAGLMNIVQDPLHGQHMVDATKEAVARAEKRGFTTLTFSPQGELYTLPDDVEEEDVEQLFSGPIIAKRDSGVMGLFKKYLGTKTTPLVEEKVEWLVLNPNVLDKTDEIEGRATGEGVVYVDTKTDKEDTFPTLSPVLAHEAQHEATPKVTARLHNELEAFKTGKDLASWLFGRTESKQKKYKLHLSEEEKESLRLDIDDGNRRIVRGEYLAQASFGADFQNVYPPATITAGNLLSARIPEKVLAKYETVITGNSLDEELSVAVQTALIAHRFNLNDAVVVYERMLKENELQQKNARSALDYLLPRRREPQEGGWSFDGTLHVPDRNPFKDLLEAIQMFFADEEKDPYANLPEQTVQRYVPQKKREAKQREELQSLEARILPNNYERMERELNDKFPKLRGDPDRERGEWTYKGWQADARGKTIIMYQSFQPSFSLQGEDMYLTKQDRYENGRFVEAFWNFLPKYEDRTSVPKIWDGSVWVEIPNFVIYPPRQEERVEDRWVITEPFEGEVVPPPESREIEIILPERN